MIIKRKLRVLRYIFTNAAPFKWLLFLHIFVVVFNAIDTSLWPYVSKLLVDKIANSPKDQIWNDSKLLIALFIFLTILPGLVWRITDYSWSFLTPLMRRKIVVDSSKLMLKKSHDFFYNNPSGSLANRIKDLSQNTPRLLDTILYSFLTIFLSLAVAFYTLWHTHKVFAFGLVIWAVIFAYMAVKALELTAKMSADVTSSQAKSFGNIVDVFSNIQNVKYFTNEDEEIDRISRHHTDHGNFFRIRGLFLIKFYTIHGLLFSVYFSLVVVAIVYYYSKGVLSLGDFVLIFTINSWMINSMWRMASQLQKFSGDFGAVDHSLRILEKPLKVRDYKNAKELNLENPLGPKIVFQDVIFNYREEYRDRDQTDKTLDVNSDLMIEGKLEISAGQKVGLVGPSGSGKSTFINLLMRSYDVDKGKILINDQDIKRITQESLRKNISMIPQEPLLFHRSIVDNIKYAKLDATKKEVESVIKKAHCHKFINKLPRKGATMVGDRGSRMSGGQKQRLSIARAFLEDSKILIMDESTSNLDNATESLINSSLSRLMKDKTVIIAAHKMTTLNEMDKILVFKEGGIVEIGNHEELLKKKSGYYKKMWQHQSVELHDLESDDS